MPIYQVPTAQVASGTVHWPPLAAVVEGPLDGIF